mgnify:CR=1 FL=1
MKALHTISIIAVFAAATVMAPAQSYPDEYLGLPGDNLNLYAVMNLFQQSETLEGFEQNLNDEGSMINNLDLNGDNLVDVLDLLMLLSVWDCTGGCEADLNADGHLDIMYYGHHGGGAAIWFGNGDGTFQGARTTVLSDGLSAEAFPFDDFEHGDLHIVYSSPAIG